MVGKGVTTHNKKGNCFMPKVSVLMPLYNAEKYVKKAIQSILLQTFEDFELILIDDCPTDHTMEIVADIQDPRIKIVKHNENKGISAARNTGFKACSGKYIALMDDDDLASKDRLEKEVAYLEQQEDIDVVGGRYCMIDENDKIVQMMGEPLRNPYFIKASLMFYDPIGNGSTMFRREFVERHKIRYQDHWLGMEDYRFWIDCSLHGKITNLNDVFLYWRNGNHNESARVNENLREQRKRKFAELQKYALIQNGYHLDDSELLLLHKMYPEGKLSDLVSIKEIEELYKIFRKMIHQAEEMRVENLEELSLFCRKHFSLRLEHSEIWK